MITFTDGFLEQRIDDEMLLYNPHTREVYTLNRPAWEVWELCRRGVDRENLAQELEAELEIEPSEAVEVTEQSLVLFEQNRLIQGSFWSTRSTRRNFLRAALLPVVVAAIAKPAVAASASCSCAGVGSSVNQSRHVGVLTGPLGTGDNCCATGLQPGFGAPGMSPSGNSGCAGCVACQEGTSGLCSCMPASLCTPFLRGPGTFVAETCVVLVSSNNPNVCGN